VFVLGRAPPRIMPFAKRPREKMTVVIQGRTVPVEYYAELERSRKRFRVNFRANEGPSQRVVVRQSDEHHDTPTEAEVQAAVLAHLGKHPLALPPAEEDEDPNACAVDAGEEGDQDQTLTRRKQPKREHTERDFLDQSAGVGSYFATGRRLPRRKSLTETVSKLDSSKDGDIRKFLTKLSKRTRIPEETRYPEGSQV